MKARHESAPTGARHDRGEAFQSCRKHSPPRADIQDPITVEDHAAWIQAQSDRLEALRIVERIAGTTRHFLNTRQPALGDLTGRELLEQQPAETLERLRELERSKA